jgi:hypothetical protein
MIGKKVKKLTVKSLHHIGKNHQKYWLCVCDCGDTYVKRQSLLKGNTASCECERKKQYEDAWKKSVEKRKINLPHHRKLKGVRINMISRCYNKNNKRYNNYGGRGITVFQDWIDFPIIFYKWCIDNGYCPTLQIDRIDNDKGYFPENCRFVTQKQNINNTSRNLYITYKGKTQSLSLWADELGFTYSTLKHRYDRKWSIEKMMETPARKPREKIESPS